VANRLVLVELLPESVQQLVREGKIAAQIAMRYLAPVARISVEHCQRMAAAFAEQSWTSRQAGEFYQAWRWASIAVRERMLSSPKLFRKTQEPFNTLDKELNQITAIAQQALHQLQEPPANRTGAQRKIQRAIELLTELQQRIEETETNHVEPIAASHDPGTRIAGSVETRDRTPAEGLAPKRPPCVESQLERRTEDRAGRESYSFPPADSRTAGSVQRQSRASP
jgi:hypothetical protein